MIAFLRCSEDRDRTYDLRVMSPTSYRCSTSRCCGANVGGIFVTAKLFFSNDCNWALPHCFH